MPSIKTNLARQVAGFLRAIERANRPAAWNPKPAPRGCTPAAASGTCPAARSRAAGPQTRSLNGTVMGQTLDLSGSDPAAQRDRVAGRAG